MLIRADDMAVSTQTLSGLSVTVEPVNKPDFYTKARAYCRDVNRPICAGERVSSLRYEKNIGGVKLYGYVKWGAEGYEAGQYATVCGPMVDLVLIVRIKNETLHSLDLSSAVMQLEDSEGRTFEPMRGLKNCPGSLPVVDTARENPNAWPGTVRVLPGKQREATAAFCFSPDYPKPPMNLLIYDVPVETDVAGNVTRRENFTFEISGNAVYRYLAPVAGGRMEWSERPPICNDYGYVVDAKKYEEEQQKEARKILASASEEQIKKNREEKLALAKSQANEEDKIKQAELLRRAEELSAEEQKLGIWTDGSTGLVWQRSACTESLTWSDAKARCESNADGLPGTDWHLPTAGDLEALLNRDDRSPGCNWPDVFSGQCGSYWSSSYNAMNPLGAEAVDFKRGASRMEEKDGKRGTRCVRSGL